MGRKVNRARVTTPFLPGADTAYGSMRNGHRWFITNSTRGTGLTCSTSFSATAPNLLIDSGTTNNVVTGTLTLSQGGTVAGGMITLQFALDNKSRFSSGGTALTPAQTSFNFTDTSDVAQARENPTANAAGASIRYFAPITWAAALGNNLVVNFSEGYEIGISQSLLFWAYAATTAPTLFYNWEWIEEEA